MLIVTAALTCSQAPIMVNGSEGLAILNSLTENQLNHTNESINSTNNTTALDRTKDASSDFWSWGTRPKNLSLESTPTDYLSDPTFSL